MARKDLMKGLMEAPETKSATPKPPARVDPAKPRYTSGAIGAVSRSIADLKSRSIVDLDPRMIDNAGLKDRLDKDDPDHAALVKSIEEYGQQVPVLVRFSPNYEGRYEVVYGRRRVRALKDLGLPIRAMVRDLDDKALILAQGQENSARKDLTFIEKVNFARQMRDAKYDRKIIGDALAMDKTLISRLFAVADQVPVELIEAIGSAPSVGRDRWLALADKIKGRDLAEFAVGDSSDARFNAVMAATKVKPPKAKPPAQIKTTDGTDLAQVARKGDHTQITVTDDTGFADWLAENLTEIHRDWQKKRGG
ncbi:plasmid partitioning protein RepB [uncultured Sulfitobacter sp.]|uniref:plasmid partitioning protein RepB n=1 Tax=uncultured Sulfitobacter sp. TaxID=191468 RepID=UPI002625D041|nr:plasmid partitioning protein RepB [uncultured Sulfitobacter sp.]